ncbi:hypothetical protein [Aurantimonas sp. VKM B-3413]|uniref:hypothetical protein n=1 Tax=Aurantimonas sp. VKM B-3413 TaxID=2779401 RepID=UPI001E64A73F|nr:hypothetical protein [Aurantimonas sp. VKM B-3413]MCB8836924.1 hypothetical protein [Aurantimonas sp. VKM B-3413]
MTEQESFKKVPCIVEAPCIDALDLFEDEGFIWRLRAQNTALDSLRTALERESKRSNWSLACVSHCVRD